MTLTTSPARARLIWFALLIGAVLATSKALACMLPFAALAALAAVHLSRRDGIALILACWGVSQAIGFGLSGWPHDATTLLWAPGMALAAVASVTAAQAVSARTGGWNVIGRLTLAFLGGIVAFKLVLVAVATLLGDGPLVSVQPSLLAVQLPLEFAIALGLLGLYRGLVMLGVPSATPARLAAA